MERPVRGARADSSCGSDQLVGDVLDLAVGRLLLDLLERPPIWAENGRELRSGLLTLLQEPSGHPTGDRAQRQVQEVIEDVLLPAFDPVQRLFLRLAGIDGYIRVRDAAVVTG